MKATSIYWYKNVQDVDDAEGGAVIEEVDAEKVREEFVGKLLAR